MFLNTHRPRPMSPSPAPSPPPSGGEGCPGVLYPHKIRKSHLYKKHVERAIGNGRIFVSNLDRLVVVVCTTRGRGRKKF